tara:strand:- start:2145 stop:2360 length:216 start_codon:yes stop_codon:yes gene_type:complete
MKFREQVVFDIGARKFKYLHQDLASKRNAVDIVELNKRLNQTKKINIYTNAKIIVASVLCLAIITMISLKV